MNRTRQRTGCRPQSLLSAAPGRRSAAAWCSFAAATAALCACPSVLVADDGTSSESVASSLGTCAPLLLGVVIAAAGVWLMLPPRRRSSWNLGSACAVLGLGLVIYQFSWTGSWARQIVFWLLASFTLASAAGTITLRSPVYCALCFALSLLGTAALFLFLDAQFLGVATIIVYAGAILVTFLFVLMLAQPAGHAFYDRVSWGPWVSPIAITCGAAMAFGLGWLLLSTRWPTPRAASNLADPNHMARFGAQLFSRHLLSVEVAGTLLLVALVGAIAIVIQTQDNRRPAAQEKEN